MSNLCWGPRQEYVIFVSYHCEHYYIFIMFPMFNIHFMLYRRQKCNNKAIKHLFKVDMKVIKPVSKPY